MNFSYQGHDGQLHVVYYIDVEYNNVQLPLVTGDSSGEASSHGKYSFHVFVITKPGTFLTTQQGVLYCTYWGM